MTTPHPSDNPSDNNAWEYEHPQDLDTATDEAAPISEPSAVNSLIAIYSGKAHVNGFLNGYAQYGTHSDLGVRIAYASVERIPPGIQGLIAGNETDPLVLATLAASPFTHPAVISVLAALEPTPEYAPVVLAAVSNPCMETDLLTYFTYSGSLAVSATAKMKLAQRFRGDNIV